jgi:hypothetical protein
MIDESIRWTMRNAESWSVEYRGMPYDDARELDGSSYIIAIQWPAGSDAE